MNIDFRLLKKEEVTHGLVMKLIPGKRTDEMAEKEAIFIEEDVFGFVERCVAKAWPKYANYGHWGSNEIPAETWSEIVTSIAGLRAKFLDATSPAELREFIYLQSDEMTALYFDKFLETKSLIIKMMDELTSWIEKKIPSCSVITLVGI